MQLFSFKDNLKLLMAEKDLNNVSLAIKTEIPANTISRYVTGDAKYPSLNNAFKLSKFFNISLDFLFGKTSNNEINNKPNKLTFYETYLKLLKDNDKTNAEVCKSAQINRKNIYEWAAGRMPTMRCLIKLADYFGESLDYLVGRYKKAD